MGWQGWLAKNGLDLGLGALSLLGGDDDPFQKRQSYRGQGLADPVNSLNTVLAAIQNMAGDISSRKPMKMSGMQGNTPAPVSIEGIPFQIGGGLATPMDFPMLEFENPQNPFQQLSQMAPPQGARPNQGARRRSPGGGD